MMSETMNEPQIGDVVLLPLTKLIEGKDNPRTVKDADADNVMYQSLKARGLLQNLIVLPSEKAKGKFVVRVGNTRLRGLRRLAAEGEIPKDRLFHCRIGDPINIDDEALTENLIRKAMNPADEFEAFARLLDSGQSVQQIATNYGKTERQIQDRLALGKAAECVRKALKKEAISLDVAKAFADCPDIARQERIYGELKNGGHWTASKVKRELSKGRVSEDDDLARFVGLETYKEAGGVCEAQLLSDEVFLTDIDLLAELHRKKLDDAKAQLLEEGWSWVEILCGYTHSAFDGLDKVYGEELPLTDEASAEIWALENEQENMSADDGPWTDEKRERDAVIEARLEVLREPKMRFTEEQKSVAGCIIYPSGGELVVDEGLVREEDSRNAKKLLADGDDGDAGGEDGVAAEDDASDEEKPVFGKGLGEDMRVFRAQALQAALAENPDLAIRVGQFVMARSILHKKGAVNAKLGIHGKRTELRVLRGELGETGGAICLERVARDLPLEVLRKPSLLESWAAFTELEEAVQRRLIAYAVALTVEPFGTTGLAPQVAYEMGIRLRTYWKPDDESFFARIKKEQLETFLFDMLGSVKARELTRKGKAKKSKLVEICDKLMMREIDVSSEAEDRLEEWTPEGMGFDTPAEDVVDESEEDSDWEDVPFDE